MPLVLSVRRSIPTHRDPAKTRQIGALVQGQFVKLRARQFADLAANQAVQRACWPNQHVQAFQREAGIIRALRARIIGIDKEINLARCAAIVAFGLQSLAHLIIQVTLDFKQPRKAKSGSGASSQSPCAFSKARRVKMPLSLS